MRYQAALIVLALSLLTGCPGPLSRQLRDVQPPEVVTVAVEKRVDLPEWATAQLPNPAPASGRVEDVTRSNDARGATIDYANCRSRLIERVQKGEKVDRKECER